MFDLSNPTLCLLSLIIFLPAAGALVLCFLPASSDEVDQAVLAGRHGGRVRADGLDGHSRRRRRLRTAVSPWARPACRTWSAIRWIPAFDIYYFLGIDGISFPLVMLTSFLSMLAMGASWPIDEARQGLLHPVPAAWKRACWACSWRWTSSCSTCSGK